MLPNTVSKLSPNPQLPNLDSQAQFPLFPHYLRTNMSMVNRTLAIGFMNIQRQTKLPLAKQLQIEDFVKQNKIDILHIQEIEICEESFCDCSFLSESFNILSNNSENGYGTASLIRADLEYTNVKFDTAGRAIVFDIGEISFGNFYAHSGTDNISRSNRENYFSETVPSLLTSCKPSGCMGGDLNSITEKIDATTYPGAKMSPSFKRLS